MKKYPLALALFLLLAGCQQQDPIESSHPLQNKYPLTPKEYMELPLGDINVAATGTDARGYDRSPGRMVPFGGG